MPPDRAAATVGDWMEDAAERGPVWFWSCVIRTMSSRVWHDLSESPAAMTRVGLIGFARGALVPLGEIVLVFAFLVATDNKGDIRYRHDWVYTYIITWTNSKPPLPGDLEPTWPIQVAMHFLWASRLFQCVGWISRTEPRREMAGCVAVSLAGWIAVLALELLPLWTIFRPVPCVIPMAKLVACPT